MHAELIARVKQGHAFCVIVGHSRLADTLRDCLAALEAVNDLPEKLARAIFAVGDDSHDKTQRIAFKGGKWPEAETDLVGLCEEALATVIRAALANLPEAMKAKS